MKTSKKVEETIYYRHLDFVQTLKHFGVNLVLQFEIYSGEGWGVPIAQECYFELHIG